MSQTQEFISAVVRSLPEIPADIQQGWIESPKGLAKVLREALCPPKWCEKDGVIYFSVTSNGKSGEEWIVHFKQKGCPLSKGAKRVLCSPDFKSTNSVTTKVAVLKGELFSNDDRITRKIRANAVERKLVTPSIELGCLVRDMFTDDEIRAMGINWLVTFHEPVVFDGPPHVLAASAFLGDERLDTSWADPDDRLDRDRGFVFAVLQ